MDVIKSILSFAQHSKTWEKIKTENGAKRYCAKYASKVYQKQVPKWFRDIGRFWGASRDIRENRLKPKIIELTEDELREVLRAQGKDVADWDVLPRFLWGITDPKL